jgi:hypothetical protein
MSNRQRRQQQTRPLCWYCDVPGVTAEHVFARSLSSLFPGHGVFRFDYEHPDLGVRRRPRRASKLMIKSRRFCEGCNSGWMNRIDQDARRLLRCFALDARTSFDEADQRVLSLWSTKTVLGLLSIEPPGYRFAGRELYHELFDTAEPLSRSQIWVGANVEGDVAWGRGHTVRFETLGEDAAGFGFTLSFGYGVLHFLQHARDDVLLRLRYAPHRALRQIWPIAEPIIPWPPTTRVRPRDLSGLAIEVANNSTLVSRSPAPGGADSSEKAA